MAKKKKSAEKKEEKTNKPKKLMTQGNSLGASGFTLGILSILFSGIFGIPMSILGFIFCIIQQKNKPTKIGKAGLILNAVGFILSILWFIYGPSILNNFQDQLQNFPSS